MKSGYDPATSTDLLTLPGHHIHRVVQKYAADLGRRFGHENARGGKASHGQRQCADVILMGVRDQDRFDLVVSDRFEIRQRILTSVLGMHSAIEHQSVAANLEIV